MIEEFIFGVIELDNDLAINAASADARAWEKLEGSYSSEVRFYGYGKN